MPVQTAARMFLVAFAAVLVGRVTDNLWLAPVTIQMALAAWVVEARQLAAFAGACGAVPWREQPDSSGLSSAASARCLPWIVASMAVLSLAVGVIRPGWLGPSAPVVLLALCHGTAFRAVQFLSWPLAAAEVSRAWRTTVSPVDLAALSGVRQVALLKRGVLTVGVPQVERVASFDDQLKPEDVLRLAAALMRNETSPLAEAVSGSARRSRMALPNVSEPLVIAQLARSGRINGQVHYLGGARLAEHLGCPLPELAAETEQVQAAGGTVLVLCTDDAPLGMIVLHDPWRPGADQLAEGLRSAGVRRIGALTDDDPDAAAATARRLGLNSAAAQVTNAALEDEVACWAARGPVALVVPAGAAGFSMAQATITLHTQGAAPGDSLSLPEDNLAALAAAWQAIRDGAERERRLNRRLLLGVAATAMAALLGAPLWLVFVADELMVVGVLRHLSGLLPAEATPAPTVAGTDESPLDEPQAASEPVA